MFCSNAFYSLDNTPGFLRVISKGNPFQWFVNALRSAFDLSWGQYFTNIGLILIVTILAFLLALKTFRYTNV